MRVQASLLAFALLLTGCAPATTPTPSPTPSQTAKPTPTASPTETPVETVASELYFTVDTPRGFRLASETQQVAKTQTDFSAQLIGDLISGKLQPKDHDYVNLWDSTNSLNSLVIHGRYATVDINLGKLNVGAEAEARAIDQIVYTLTAVEPKVTNVKLLVNGKKVETLAGHVGTLNSFTVGNGFEVLLAVQINSILDGQEVSNPVKISGEACTFEAQLAWALKLEGKVIRRGTTLADGACPDREEWRIDLDDLEPGIYTLGVSTFSAKDGSLEARDNKTFTVK